MVGQLRAAMKWPAECPVWTGCSVLPSEMELETLIRDERDRLTRRLGSVLGGDLYAAEDLCQEAFTRAWQSLPRELDGERQRAWLRRTAGNLAIDELRKALERLAGELMADISLSERDAGRAAAHPAP